MTEQSVEKNPNRKFRKIRKSSTYQKPLIIRKKIIQDDDELLVDEF